MLLSVIGKFVLNKYGVGLFKTCLVDLVLSVTRIQRAALTKFRVYVCMCVTTPPKPLNRFA